MSKVYAVTRGTYSDYSIEKLFTTREAAEKYCAINHSKYWDNTLIEEWELEDGSNIQCENVYKAIACSVSDKDSYIIDWVFRYSTSPYKFSAITTAKISYTKYIIPINRDVTNADHIRKIIHDTVAQYKAGTMGL